MSETGTPGGNRDFTHSDPADGRTHRQGTRELGRLRTSRLGAAWASASQCPRFLDENLTT